MKQPLPCGLITVAVAYFVGSSSMLIRVDSRLRCDLKANCCEESPVGFSLLSSLHPLLLPGCPLYRNFTLLGSSNLSPRLSLTFPFLHLVLSPSSVLSPSYPSSLPEQFSMPPRVRSLVRVGAFCEFSLFSFYGRPSAENLHRHRNGYSHSTLWTDRGSNAFRKSRR